MARCRTCSTEIDFIKLADGRFHPVNGGGSPETYYVATGDRAGAPQVIVVTHEGALLRGRSAKAHEMGTVRAEGWVSHFSTCQE